MQPYLFSTVHCSCLDLLCGENSVSYLIALYNVVLDCVRFEEELLGKFFGTEYEQYKRDVTFSGVPFHHFGIIRLLPENIKRQMRR